MLQFAEGHGFLAPKKMTRLCKVSVHVAAIAVIGLLSGSVAAQGKKQPSKPPAKAAQPADTKETAGSKAATGKGEKETAGKKAAEKEGAGVTKVETDGKGEEGVKKYTCKTIEVEGRLKSPQLLYFLRRVRAEFEAGQLGHRSFLRELSDTRRHPALR